MLIHDFKKRLKLGELEQMINDERARRKLLRLVGYHYRQCGYYYLTLCTQNRHCLFGRVHRGEMILNDAGKMVHEIWSDIPKKYRGFGNDLFVLMPNHLHGILLKYNDGGPTQGSAPTLILSDVVRYFKMFTTRIYIKGVREKRFAAFDRRLWQRNYYEHVIRNETALNRIRQYMIENPLKWSEDQWSDPHVGPHKARIVALACRCLKP